MLIDNYKLILRKKIVLYNGYPSQKYKSFHITLNLAIFQLSRPFRVVKEENR